MGKHGLEYGLKVTVVEITAVTFAMLQQNIIFASKVTTVEITVVEKDGL